MIKIAIGSWLLAVFSVPAVTRSDGIAKEDGKALRRKYCSAFLREVEAVCHIQQERQYYHSYTAALWDSVEGSQTLTVARERDSDSSFPAGSDRVESFLCYLSKRFDCVWGFLIQCLSTTKSHELPKTGIRCHNSPESIPVVR